MDTTEIYIDKPFEFEEEIDNIFGKGDNLVIFDIGACEGEDSIKFEKKYINAKVYAFEPLPSNIIKINNNMKKYNTKNIVLSEIALSDRKGNAEFFVSSGKPKNAKKDDWDYGNKSSSLLSPEKAKEVHSWLKFDNKIKVKTDTLDNFAKVNNISKINFVYMDVQGAEKLVLEGAKRMIKCIDAIWLEVESVELYKGQPLKREIESFMEMNGFIKIKDTVDEVSGDQLYVKSKLFDIYKTSKANKTPLRRLKNRLSTINNITIRSYGEYQPKTKLISSLKNSKKSYSQTGEDIIIKTALAELGILKPSYLDIGAHHPYYLNNTALFYKQGSRGVNVEPDPELFKKFERFRKNDTNLNMGIAEVSGTLKLHIMSSTTLNTFSEKEAKQYEKLGYPIKKTVNIKVANINTIIKKYFGNKAPNLLSVDVEGLDYKILKSLDFKKYSPEIICAETIEFSKDGTGKKDDRIPRLLASNGYEVYADTKINTIFIKADREKQ